MEFWFGIALAAIIGLLLGLLAGVAMVQPRLNKIKRRWRESSSALATLQTEADQLNKSLTQTQSELADAQAQLTSVNKEVASLNKEKETLQNESVTIRNSLNQISQEKERIFLDLVSQRAENDKLRAELDDQPPAQAEEPSLNPLELP